MNSSRELLVSGDEAHRELKRRTRRGFLVGGAASLVGLAGYEWLTHSANEESAPAAQRRVLELNEKLWHAYESDKHLMPQYGRERVQTLKENGDVGLEDDVPDDWKLRVVTGGGRPALNLSLADIKALPRREMITRFCCIEGWSVVTQWTGARFSDFTRKYFPPSSSLPAYVSLRTPDEKYFVGLDMKSALHPQTLLAYEHNGAELTDEHGAPLRLAIPVKYGVKNLKRIGTIEYTSTRPRDYWAEDGYDWFAGL